MSANSPVSPNPSHPPVAPPKPLAMRLIMIEKAVKAIFVLVVACFFTVLLVTGSSVHLHGLATHIRQHLSAAWTVYLADEVVSVTERRHLVVMTSALFLDGMTTGLEWYALSKGRSWGEWLVVVAMAALIPFEVHALIHAVHVGRVVVLVGNLLIVAYLARHAWKRHVVQRALGPG